VDDTASNGRRQISKLYARAYWVGFTSDTTKKALVTIVENGKIVVSEVQKEKPAEPEVPAAGSQPIRPETIRTSPAAGSRR